MQNLRILLLLRSGFELLRRNLRGQTQSFCCIIETLCSFSLLALPYLKRDRRGKALNLKSSHEAQKCAVQLMQPQQSSSWAILVS